MVSLTPLVTDTPTPAPAGVFAFYFYSPLTMDYDPSMWEFKNVLQSKQIASCYIGEQGPTDFNGPHKSEVIGHYEEITMMLLRNDVTAFSI
jgi:hypothetical protein